jgi:hypothetical protein
MTAKSTKARVRRARAAARSPSRRSATKTNGNGNANGTWPTLLVAGGVLGAAALVALSPKVWSRVGSMVFGTGARLARWSLAPALVGTILSRVGTGIEQGGRALREVTQVPKAH